jgi:phosphate transport system protein
MVMAMSNPATPPPSPGAQRRLAYHRELEELDARVIRLGAVVCETIPRGTEVLLSGDLGQAQALIDADDEVDLLAIEVEDHCYSIIVRQAPMAGELRHLVTVSKMVHELERSADLMVNISKAARRLHGSPMSPKIRGVVAAMSTEANKLMRLAIDAFADADASLASALKDIDDKLDQLNRDMVEVIFEAHGAGQIDLGAAVQLALVARYYERIGDHAVNIGERVTYMVTGWLPEHNAMLRERHRASGPAGERPPPPAENGEMAPADETPS